MENELPVSQRRRVRRLLTFMIPLFLVILVLVYVFFIRPTDSDCFEAISYETAEQYVRNYQYHAEMVSDEIFKGYSITMCQYEMMQKLFEEDADAQAVRFYFGMVEGKPDTLLIATAVNSEGSNNPEKMLMTKLDMAGLCPRFCDDNSPLLETDENAMPDYAFGEGLSVESARQLITWYEVQNHLYSGVMKGMVVSREQFGYMSQMRGVPEAQGFRIYFGAANKGAEVITLICPVDQSGKDLTTMIIPASKQFAGLCPRLCDQPEVAAAAGITESVW